MPEQRLHSRRPVARGYRAYGAAAPQLDRRYGVVAPEFAPDVNRAGTNIKQQSATPTFQVLEGRGLDAHEQAGVNPKFMTIAVGVVVAIVSVFVVSMLIIALMSACQKSLTEVATLRSEISSAQDQNRSLYVEGAVLSNPSRIADIVTNNFGMVYADPGSADTITVNLG